MSYYQKNKDHILAQINKKRLENPELIKQRKKDYRIKYKQQIKEKHGETFICECSRTFTYNHKSRHIRTKYHQKYLNQK